MSKPTHTSPVLELVKWYQRQKRVLPWRDQPTLYRVWISEIMLQQTQVVTVIPYFEKFLSRFPSVHELAQADEQEVLRYWAGLGYYARARNLHRAAKKMSENGFPRTREGWLEVPGVGPYTAGAILSIALNQPEAILDGNVERVLARVYCEGKKEELWKRSSEWVKKAVRLKKRPTDLNQALMELGALVCSPSTPQCLLCPVRQSCLAFRNGRVEEFPRKKRRSASVRVSETVRCYLMRGRKGARVLLRKRSKGEWREGLWDLLDSKECRQEGRSQKTGKIATKYVVTKHRVSRMTEVHWVSRPLLKAAQSKLADSERWVSLEEPEVPLGAPVKVVFEKIRQQLPFFEPTQR